MLKRGLCGFINGWFAESESVWVVDKNRGWLNQLSDVLSRDLSCRIGTGTSLLTAINLRRANTWVYAKHALYR